MEILLAKHLCRTRKDLKRPDEIEYLGPRRRNEQHPPRPRLNLLLLT